MSKHAEHGPTVPDAIWAPVSSGALILVIGLIALVTHQPLLFPSLGPTTFLQTETPESPSARPYKVVPYLGWVSKPR